jgi:hypothetical protein
LLASGGLGLGIDEHTLFRFDPEHVRATPVLHADMPLLDALGAGTSWFLLPTAGTAILRVDRDGRQTRLETGASPQTLAQPRGDGELWVATHDATGTGLSIFDLSRIPARRRASLGLPTDRVLGMVGVEDKVFVVGDSRVVVVEGWPTEVEAMVPCPYRHCVAWTLLPQAHALVLATQQPPALEVVDTRPPHEIHTVSLPSPPLCMWQAP